MSSVSRSQILSSMYKTLGFNFKEEDLSPKLRRKIGILAQKLDQYNQVVSLKRRNKAIAENRIYTIIGLVIVGIVFCFMYLIGIVFFGIAYLVYRSYKARKEEGKKIEARRVSLQSELQNQIGEISKSAYRELSELHEARIRPKVKHLMVDFGDIIDAAKEKGIILTTIECPYCGGSVEIPEKGEFLECKHCGKTIRAINVFEKFRDLLNP